MTVSHFSFLSMPISCSGCHDVEPGNENILQHLQCPGSGRVENVRYGLFGLALTTTTTVRSPIWH